MFKTKVLIITIFILLFSVGMKAESKEWKIIERYSVIDFDKEGNNIYLGEDGFFYIDKINITNKELVIAKYNKEKKLVDVIKTGIIYEKTDDNEYFRRNEKIAILISKQQMYIYYPRKKNNKLFDEIWMFNLQNNKEEKIINLNDIEWDSVFGYVKRREFYEDYVSDRWDFSYQIKLVIENNKILLDGFYALDGAESNFAHDYYVFDSDGQQLYSGYTDSYEAHKKNYPISLRKNGEIIKGMLAEEEMEKLANNLGYTIVEGWTFIYRGFNNSDLYIDREGNAWLSRNMWKAGTKKRDDINYESSIYGLVEENGKWKVKEFINLFNFPELRYNVFIDRILKVEDNKLWLWVRIGHNITGPYEDRYFDREIWVIEKN